MIVEEPKDGYAWEGEPLGDQQRRFEEFAGKLVDLIEYSMKPALALVPSSYRKSIQSQVEALRDEFAGGR